MIRVDTTGGTVTTGGQVALRLAGDPSPSGAGPASRSSGYPGQRWVGAASRPVCAVRLTETELAALTEALAIAAYPRTGEVYETATDTWHAVTLGAVNVSRAGDVYTGTIEVML